MEEGNNNNNNNNKVGLEKKARPQEQLNCPRCNSTNTKFCYYNNYSLTQPRYFCKTCRRYWTEGGSLRNVPVGGGSRKNKKLITTTTNNPSSSSSSAKLLPDLNPPSTTSVPSSSTSSQNLKMLMHGGQDLNLSFPPIMENYDHHHGLSYHQNSSSSSTSSSSTSALMLLRAGMASSNNHHPFVHNPILMQNSNNSNVLFPASGFNHPMHEVKPASLGFSVEDHHHQHHQGLRSRYGVHQENDNGGGGRLLFPFGDVKQMNPAGAHHHEVDGENNKEHAGNNSSSGYWTGMIGEGSW